MQNGENEAKRERGIMKTKCTPCSWMKKYAL
jgi:hypothetical protein